MPPMRRRISWLPVHLTAIFALCEPCLCPFLDEGSYNYLLASKNFKYDLWTAQEGEGKFMFSKTLVTAAVLSCALLVTHSYARADSSAEDAYNKALDACASGPKGQRSFCFIEAHDKYKASMGMEQKHDYSDTSKDTPAQTKAKADYAEAADACADENKGQRAFCMEEAHEAYMQAMGLAPK